MEEIRREMERRLNENLPEYKLSEDGTRMIELKSESPDYSGKPILKKDVTINKSGYKIVQYGNHHPRIFSENDINNEGIFVREEEMKGKYFVLIEAFCSNKNKPLYDKPKSFPIKFKSSIPLETKSRLMTTMNRIYNRNHEFRNLNDLTINMKILKKGFFTNKLLDLESIFEGNIDEFKVGIIKNGPEVHFDDLGIVYEYNSDALENYKNFYKGHDNIASQYNNE